MRNYYYVYNRANDKPLYRHKTLESAITEAHRLAKLNHQNFYVLQPVAHVRYNHGAGTCTLNTPEEHQDLHD